MYDEEYAQRGPLPVNPAVLRIEMGRLRRALKLWCIPLGNRQYCVQGSNEPQWVDFYGDEACYCEDALISRQGAAEDEDIPRYVCKHVLCALLHEGHPRVVALAKQEEEFDEQRNRWAHTG